MLSPAEFQGFSSSPRQTHLPNYPIPGSYHIRDFIEETGLNPIPRTYGFKGPERNTLMSTVRRGDVLLPGAYNFTDSTNEALRHQATYSFKSCPRPDIHTLGLRDKDINLSPGHYDVTEKPVPKSPCKHMMFRSAVQRVSFLPCCTSRTMASVACWLVIRAVLAAVWC
ncbi:Protein STPG4 [Labeo rohita]|uniref:Protein STPG4 n=1 Tax=Labeo rohita TaxID=84645 RepID=A0ABQ8M404_LABRO|nr:Protein STPG4 [Labeo rohita]